MTLTTLRLSGLFILVVLMTLGCGKPPPKQDPRLVGNWGLQQPGGGIDIVIEFVNDGKFKVNRRSETLSSGSADKKVENASGTWTMDRAKNQLTLVTQKEDPKIGWPAQTVIYNVIALTPLTFHLMDPWGKHYIWKKMSKSSEKTEPGKEEKTVNLKITPLVANLAPSKNTTAPENRWICTGVELYLVNYDPAIGLHPQIQEKAIFFFASKTYEELNTPAKLAIATYELRNVLNPYLDNRIKYLMLQRTTITGRIDVVDQFLSSHEKSEEGKKEGGKKEEKKEKSH